MAKRLARAVPLGEHMDKDTVSEILDAEVGDGVTLGSQDYVVTITSYTNSTKILEGPGNHQKAFYCGTPILVYAAVDLIKESYRDQPGYRVIQRPPHVLEEEYDSQKLIGEHYDPVQQEFLQVYYCHPMVASALSNAIPAAVEPHKCHCDYKTVLARYGCQCGGV